MPGRYHIGDLLALGAQSRIYRAFDRITERNCILKAGSSARQEALLALEINHPFLARPFDVGEDPKIGNFSAYPEFAQPSFLQWMKSGPADSEIRRVALQLAEFLSYLHQRGYLYNDFKPEHFLIGATHLIVLDLGLCSAMTESSRSFSGTFPYISPERVTGREVDARSDLFAAGILLLHGFHHQEDWNEEPSLSALQDIQSRCKNLKGFWRHLISEMTAFEPGQRIGSATELWKRLSPESQTILFFVPPSHFSLPHPTTNLCVRSGSSMNLKEAERQIQIQTWQSQQRTIELDFRAQSLQIAVRNLADALTEENHSNFYSAVEKLQSLSGTAKFLIILKNADHLNEENLCLLQFILSAVASHESFRFFLPLPERRDFLEIDRDNWMTIELPLITKETRDDLMLGLFPGQKIPRAVNELLHKNFSSPEQILWELRSLLGKSNPKFWPAAATCMPAQKTIDSLNSAEKKLLTILALAGGKISRVLLLLSLKKTEREAGELLVSLHRDGFLHDNGDWIHLTFSTESVLSRLRKTQIRQSAERIIEACGNALLQDPGIAYEVSRKAGASRIAALAALRMSRRAQETANREEQHQWLVNAFLCGAVLPRRLLFRIAVYEMRRCRMETARKAFRNIKKRFGNSYHRMDLLIDYYRRKDKVETAIRIAECAAQRANTRGHEQRKYSFLAWKAYLLVIRQRIDEGDDLLSQLVEKRLNPSIRTHVNIGLGISLHYHGRLNECVSLLRSTLKSSPYFRSRVLMALGASYGRMGKFKEGIRCLLLASRLFEAQQDTQRLTTVYNNLGTTFRFNGDFSRARLYFYRSLSLSRMVHNSRDYIGCLNNLANSYEAEGRTDRAIAYHEKALRIAQKTKLKFYVALVQTNLGLQYAIKGELKKARELLHRSIVVRKKLGVRVNVALSYEYLGICYMVSGHPTRALGYFKSAGTIFEQCSCENDHYRTELFRALCFAKTKQHAKAIEILASKLNADQNSFGRALHSFVTASLELASNQWRPAICRDALHESERIFRKLPSLFWLAQLYYLKVEYAYRTDHYEKAILYLETAFNLFSRLGAKREVLKLEKWGKRIKMPADFSDKMAQKLPYKVLLMLKDVLATNDPDSMISAILTTALEFTDMDRAVLVLQDNPPRIFKTAVMDEGAVSEIYEISKSAMDASSESGEPFICFDVPSHPYIKSKPSIIGNHIMSIVCLPLKAQEKTIGLLYLDSKEGVESLTKTENLLLEIFGSIIALALNRALDLEKSMEENKYLRDTVEWRKIFPEIIGKSKAVIDIFKTLQRLLDNELPVLIYGETGTGKELIARVLHYCGKRKNGAFIAINCSAFSKELMESELFGHEKGAFTGASNLKRGLFEEAQNGTLFFDEISELPFSMQAKLLRVLQGGEYRRVGGTQTLRSNARIVFATNRDLVQMVKGKEFREDLYYRIRGVQVRVPPLRERKDDIALLANEFLKEAILNTHKLIQGFTPDALAALKRYNWPGNVRQLKLEVEKIVALSENEWISVNELDPQIREAAVQDLPEAGNGSASLHEIEREVILERLKQHDGNIIQAARSLGISRHGLYSKMRRYRIPIR